MHLNQTDATMRTTNEPTILNNVNNRPHTNVFYLGRFFCGLCSPNDDVERGRVQVSEETSLINQNLHNVASFASKTFNCLSSYSKGAAIVACITTPIWVTGLVFWSKSDWDVDDNSAYLVYGGIGAIAWWGCFVCGTIINDQQQRDSARRW